MGCVRASDPRLYVRLYAALDTNSLVGAGKEKRRRRNPNDFQTTSHSRRSHSRRLAALQASAVAHQWGDGAQPV